MEDVGVTPMDAQGKEFDANLHNAVMHVEDDEFGENIVAEELQKRLHVQRKCTAPQYGKSS